MPQYTIEQALRIARQHQQAGRLAQAEALYRQILQHQPNQPDAHFNLGNALQMRGQLDAAIAAYRQALALHPNHPEAYSNLGMALMAKGQHDAAIAACRQAIALRPGLPEAYSNLGMALVAKGQHDAAVAACRQAIALKPDYPEAYFNLGNALHMQGRLDAAIAAYRQALALNPGYSEAHDNLGVALQARGQCAAALAAFHQAIALQPNNPVTYNNLCGTLQSLGQLDAALAACRQALALNPNYPEACCNLGVTLQSLGQLDAALAACRQALALKPDHPGTYNNLGNILQATGQLDAALAAHRQAVALDPDHAGFHSSLALTLHYHPACDAQAIAEEHRRWNLRHGEPLRQFIQPHANDRAPERRLRIGYVSPDFRDHAVAPMVLPLLAAHDRERFQVVCYAQVEKPDAMTEKFRAQADPWRDTVGLSDAQMADLIRQDQIDILVDLAGHTAGNRLLVFARKPAPVQINRQGYPDTTGLTTMDYRMTDAYADPPGLTEALHSEQLIRLPRTNWIYQPPEHCPVPVPRPVDMPLTFGCFNNFAKVTEPMLQVWAGILAAVPGSRLLLKAKGLASPEVRQRVQGIFQGEGIALERVELMGARPSATEHLALYSQVAIGLDPFPYHGTTTTCEALWMGVPVVTLAGQTHVARVGVSLLNNVGLPELIAKSAAEYVRIAAALAHDQARLRDLHATLRQRMQASPLLDAATFARDIEAAYRQVWRQWCGRAPS